MPRTTASMAASPSVHEMRTLAPTASFGVAETPATPRTVNGSPTDVPPVLGCRPEQHARRRCARRVEPAEELGRLEAGGAVRIPVDDVDEMDMGGIVGEASPDADGHAALPVRPVRRVGSRRAEPVQYTATADRTCGSHRDDGHHRRGDGETPARRPAGSDVREHRAVVSRAAAAGHLGDLGGVGRADTRLEVGCHRASSLRRSSSPRWTRVRAVATRQPVTAPICS